MQLVVANCLTGQYLLQLVQFLLLGSHFYLLQGMLRVVLCLPLPVHHIWPRLFGHVPVRGWSLTSGSLTATAQLHSKRFKF